MTSISLSRRAAELLGPPPDNSINWEMLIHHKPRVVVSTVPLHRQVLIEENAPPRDETEDILAIIVDVDDDEDEWHVSNNKRPRSQTNTRRVTLETTHVLETNDNYLSRRKLRRLEKQTNLKQPTIMESFGLRRST